MKPLPNGGVELTPRETFALRAVVLAMTDEDYARINCHDAIPAGLELAEQFTNLDETVAALVEIHGDGRPPAWRDRTSVELVGTALQALAA